MHLSRPLGALSGVLIAASMLTACGGTAATSPSPSSVASVAAASPSSPAAPAPSSAAPVSSAAAANAASPSSAAASTPASPAAASLVPATAVATLSVKTDAKLGAILANGAGRSVYTFSKDTPTTSACTAACLNTWPPFLSSAAPTAPSGFSGKLDVFTRTDAPVKQVTANQMLLYYFAADASPADAKGEGIGGFWHVVKAA